MKGFLTFVRDRAVMGLAIGFLLGGAVSKLVTSFVNDIVNPVIGLFLGRVGSLKNAYLPIGSAKIMWGSFVASLIDFLVISTVVYIGVRLIQLSIRDKEKDKTKK